MIENIGVIISNGVALAGLIASVFYFKRARKAEITAKELEVKSKEIGTADEMIDLVKKAHAEALQINQDIAETNKKESEKLRKSIGRLERAVNAVGNCPYRSECPVTDKLRDEKDTAQP